MPRFSSLSTRLILAVLTTATVAFSASVGLTVMRLDQGLERQAAELGRLSEEKLARRLDGAARLADARVTTLYSDMGRRLEGLAQRADVVKVVATGNVVAMWDLLGRASRAADFDGILVVDAKLRVIGADRDSLDIAATNQALQASSLARQLSTILGDNDRSRPEVVRRTLVLTEELAKAIGARTTAPLAMLVAEPMFDDFGDVFAALIAHRALRPVETTLQEFSQLEGSGLLVLAADQPISSAGIDDPSVGVAPTASRSLLKTTDGRYWSRCTEVLESWRICALAPLAELHALRDEMVRIGEFEGRSLATWLIVFALASLLSFALITLLVSRRISRPLARITEAVRAVARGDWKWGVAGADRADEVGDIARAVTVLQRSLEERDRLRSDVVQAESVKKRSTALEDAIRRFDRTMRSVLLRVSDCAETMDETARDLARMSAVAEGEAVETAFVSGNTAASVAAVRSATDRLSASISETVAALNQAAEAIDTSNAVAQSASAKAKHLARNAADIDAVARLIEDMVAQTNAVALNATVQAARAGGAGHGFAGVVADVRRLADHMAGANQEVAGRMATIRGASDEMAGATQAIAQKLDLILQQTKTIALTMERQDAVTREIADSMSAAANGTINVSSSVERLKTTVEEARGTSMKVVTKATDMADEAQRLNSTVKSFLREVTA